MIKKILLVMVLISGFSIFTMHASDRGAVQAAEQIDRLTTHINRAVKSVQKETFEQFVEGIIKPAFATINVDMIVGFKNGAQPLSLRQWLDEQIDLTRTIESRAAMEDKERVRQAVTRLSVIKALLPAPKTTAVKPDSKKPTSKATGTSENGTGGRSPFAFLKNRTTWIAGGVIAIAGWFFWNKYAKNAKKAGPQAKTGSAK